MLRGQICTGIIGKPDLLRPSIIGGGRRIVCSSSQKLQGIIQVRFKILRKKDFFKRNYLLTLFFPTGLVLFLEEDHYVAEDFISVLQLMQKTGKTSCDKCNIYSLGTYLKTYNYYADSKKVSKTKKINFLRKLKILIF